MLWAWWPDYINNDNYDFYFCVYVCIVFVFGFNSFYDCLPLSHLFEMGSCRN